MRYQMSDSFTLLRQDLCGRMLDACFGAPGSLPPEYFSSSSRGTLGMCIFQLLFIAWPGQCGILVCA